MTFDISIITCKSTYNRVENIFTSLLKLLETKEVRDIRIILEHDIEYMERAVFENKNWDQHIQTIREILAINIRDSKSLGEKKLSDLLDYLIDQFFTARELRDAEMSLLWKHFHALKMARDLPMLILEDDAELNQNQIETLVEATKLSAEKNIFVDLGVMKGLCSRGKLKISNGVSFYVQPIGCTRTTVAAIWPPDAAMKVSDNYWPCSLPADLHHQYLLSKLKLEGAWPAMSIFRHLSSGDCRVYKTSIQT